MSVECCWKRCRLGRSLSRALRGCARVTRRSRQAPGTGILRLRVAMGDKFDGRIMVWSRTAFPILMLWVLVSGFGCVPGRDGAVIVGPGTDRGREPLFSVDAVDRRIRALEHAVGENGSTARDRAVARELRVAYESMKRLARTDTPKDDRRELAALLFDTTGALQERFFAPAPGGPEAPPGAPLPGLSEDRAAILGFYRAGDYRRVITKCIELTSRYGDGVLSADIALVFALSLGSEGMVEEAVSIGEGLLRKAGSVPDIVALRSSLGRWHLALGHRREALSHYEKLTDDLDTRFREMTSLASLLGKEPAPPVPGPSAAWGARGGAPDTETAPPPRSTERVLAHARYLVQEHRFGEARNLLAVKRDELVRAGADILPVDEALRSLDAAEEQYLEERILSLSGQKEHFTRIKRLLEEEKLEEVISNLEDMEHEQGVTRESRDLKDLAVERLIIRESNRAAELFLAARKTGDIEDKRRHLNACLEILTGLVEVYPLSPLNEKLKAYMHTVRDELETLEPRG